MHLLAREEVGLRCLLRVAAAFETGPQPISSIAESEGLSPEYAAKLLRQLRLGGLVTSTRGAAGGYRLTRPPGAITVWEALQVLDSAFLPSRACECQPEERGDCRRTTHCAVQSLWRRVGDQLRGALEGTTLHELCAPEAARVELTTVPARRS